MPALSRMKLPAPLILALLLPLPLSVAKGIDGPDVCIRSSDADRNAFVAQAMTWNRGTYSPAKMRKCLDDAFAASAPAGERQSDFSTAAIICHAKLQPRK